MILRPVALGAVAVLVFVTRAWADQTGFRTRAHDVATATGDGDTNASNSSRDFSLAYSTVQISYDLPTPTQSPTITPPPVGHLVSWSGEQGLLEDGFWTLREWESEPTPKALQWMTSGCHTGRGCIYFNISSPNTSRGGRLTYTVSPPQDAIRLSFWLNAFAINACGSGYAKICLLARILSTDRKGVRLLIWGNGKLFVDTYGGPIFAIDGQTAKSIIPSDAFVTHWYQIKLAATQRSGLVTVRVYTAGGNLYTSFTTSTVNLGTGGLSSIGLFQYVPPPNNFMSPMGFYADDVSVHVATDPGSEVFVPLPATGVTGVCTNWTKFGTADGCDSTLATCIDDVPPNLSTYLASGTGTQACTFTHATAGSTVPPIAEPVHALDEFIYFSKANSAVVLRPRIADVNGADLPDDLSATKYTEQYLTQPGTSNAWTTRAIDSASYGVQSGGTGATVYENLVVAGFEKPTSTPTPTLSPTRTPTITNTPMLTYTPSPSPTPSPNKIVLFAAVGQSNMVGYGDLPGGCHSSAPTYDVPCVAEPAYCYPSGPTPKPCTINNDCPGGQCAPMQNCNPDLGDYCDISADPTSYLIERFGNDYEWSSAMVEPSDAYGVCNGGLRDGLPCAGEGQCPEATETAGRDYHLCIKKVFTGPTVVGNSCSTDADCSTDFVCRQMYKCKVTQVDLVSLDPLGANYSPLQSFGMRYIALHPNVRVGLIPCALTATCVWNDDWSPGASHTDRSTLYGSCLNRIQTALASGHASQIVLGGILFEQGECEAANGPSYIDTWGSKWASILNSFRTDLGEPHLPAAFAEIGNFKYYGPPAPTPSPTMSWRDYMRQEQAAFAATPSNRACEVLVEDMTHVVPDDVNEHLNARAQRTIGARMAECFPTVTPTPTARTGALCTLPGFDDDRS